MSIKKFFTFLGWPILLIPTLTLYVGIGMNEAVIWANGGRMPVSTYACAERLSTPQSSEDSDTISKFLGLPKAPQHQDYTHTCADKNTKLRWLDDWLISSEGIASIGDELQETASLLVYVVYPLWIAGLGYYILRRVYPLPTDKKE